MFLLRLFFLLLFSNFINAQTWNLIWQDEFNGNTLDTTKWVHEIGTGSQNGLWGWGNGELQYYQSANTEVNNGSAKIIAKEEPNGIVDSWGTTKYYSSSRITTKGIFDFKFGKVEARIKTVDGEGFWPAFWMLPTGGSWPCDGEIDIMEQDGTNKQLLYGTFHWADNSGQQASYGLVKDTSSLNISDLNSEFHLYSLIWTSSSIKVYVDNLLISELDNTASVPFDNPHYLLLNVAMGGTLGGVIPGTFEEDNMEIDFVRIYQ